MSALVRILGVMAAGIAWCLTRQCYLCNGSGSIIFCGMWCECPECNGEGKLEKL